MLIEIAAAAIGGGFVGYFACAAMTIGKMADASSNEQMLEVMTRRGVAVALDLVEAEEAHARAADALATKQARIDRLKSIAASQQSVKSGRIVAVLEGGE